jgi:hypothetical protein
MAPSLFLRKNGRSKKKEIPIVSRSISYYGIGSRNEKKKKPSIESFSEKLLTSLTFESESTLSRIDGWAFTQTGLVEIVIPASVEFLGEGCFAGCRSLTSLTFESGSRLSRIENWLFHETGLIEIVIPSSVEMLDEECFAFCILPSSVTFESGSIFSRIGNCID